MIKQPDTAHTIDIYPVGWLDVFFRLWCAYRRDIPADVQPLIRKRAWTGLRDAIRYDLKNLRHGRWHELKNGFNGFLCEPEPLPEGLQRCGSGWTMARARRSLDKQMRAANLDPAMLDAPAPDRECS